MSEDKNYALDLMDTVVPLIDEFIPNNFFNDLPSQFQINTLPGKIYFLTELLKIVRLIPLKVYTDQFKRQQLLDAIQLALDDQIAQEEEEE